LRLVFRRRPFYVEHSGHSVIRANRVAFYAVFPRLLRDHSLDVFRIKQICPQYRESPYTLEISRSLVSFLFEPVGELSDQSLSLQV